MYCRHCGEIVYPDWANDTWIHEYGDEFCDDDQDTYATPLSDEDISEMRLKSRDYQKWSEL